ncbi:MAG: LysR family transcriptional regulator [Sulfitobacter sp.]
MLNAIWLESFTTLAQTGHFTRAAQRLNMTQPGVSQHLRKLEAQLGQALIAQDGKSFVLTQAGEAVMALGLARRAQEQALRAEIEGDDPARGAVRVACSGSFALLLYPRLIALMGQAEALSLHVEAAPQARVQAMVLEGEIDLGVLSEAPRHPRITAQKIGTEELCLVLPHGAAPSAPDFEALEARGFIAHPDGFAYADALFGENFAGDYQGAEHLRQRSFINQISQIPAPVAQGVGYTLLPRSGVEGFAHKALLRVVPLAKRQHQDLWLIARRGREQHARLQHIARIITDVGARLSRLA